MPRIYRRGHQLKFSGEHKFYLMHSWFYTTNPFRSPEEERETWFRLRDSILEDWDLPGSRPSAFWKFEVEEPEPGSQYASISRLMDLQLIGDEEARLLELRHRCLNPEETEFCSALLVIPYQEMSVAMRELWRSPSQVEMFALAIRWHGWRQKDGDRDGVIEKYKRLNEIVEGMAE